MRVTRPKTLPNAEAQIERTMSLLELHGATEPILYYAVDEVLSNKNREIERLKSVLDRWSKRQ